MPENKLIPCETYEGYDIVLDPYFRFLIVKLDVFTYSIREAREKITAVNKQTRSLKKPKLALAVLDGNGNTRTLTGVHASQGHALATSVPKGQELSDEFYVDAPLTKVLLCEVATYSMRLKRAIDCLHLLHVRAHGYGSEDLPVAYQKLEDQYAQAKKVADTQNLGTLTESWDRSPKSKQKWRVRF